MSNINTHRFENAASRVAGAPFEIIGKVLDNASGYAMPTVKAAGGAWVASKGFELADKLVTNELNLASGDIANRVLYGAASASMVLGGGALATLGVIDAVKETQRLIRKESVR
jgi:hypothetical protein